jgi:hypothetical protein
MYRRTYAELHVLLKETRQDLADKMDAILKAPESEQVAPLNKNSSVNCKG